MYVIEIEEDKIDNVIEHVAKSIKCLSKVAECLEEMKGHEDYETEDDYEREQYVRGGQHSYRDRGREMYRGGGRYGRY